MDRTRPVPRATIYGGLGSILLSCVLLACAPMTGQVMPPLFPTRTLPAPTPTATVATPTPIPPSPTAISLPTPVRTAAPLAPATLDASARAWLDQAGLAGDATAPEDWEQIGRAARDEAQVWLSSDTARLLTALESFLLVHPGLDGEVHVMTADDAFMNLTRPTADPDRLANDVYLSGDGPLVIQALAQNRLWNYVPADLREAIPEPMREPLLVHHWSAMLLMQAGAASQPSPIDNWWDLTREEWQGRVALPDPAIDVRSRYLLLAMAQHAGELEEAYRLEYGEALALDPDCPDAACQWLKLFLRNKPHIVASDAEVAAWVSDPSASMKRLGICGSEQLAKVQRGKASLAPMTEVAPTAGLYWPTYLALVVGGPHPHAARVMIRWLMSDVSGSGALAPWYEAGHYFPRQDVPDPPGSPAGRDLAPRLWVLDPQFVLDQQVTVDGWVQEARAAAGF